MSSTSCSSLEELVGRNIQILSDGVLLGGRITQCSAEGNCLHLEYEWWSKIGRSAFDVSPVPTVFGDGCDRLTFAVPGTGVVTIF